MASFLDIGLLEYFLPAFTFLFIFVVSYAVLDKFKLLGDNKGLKLIASFSISILFLFSTDALKLVNFITPWFIVMVVIAMFLIALFMFMGLKEDSIVKAVGSGQVVWPIIIISIILLIVALVHVFGSYMSPYGTLEEQPQETVYSTSDDGDAKSRESESMKTLVNPKILGALFLLIIATFAISYISKGLT